MVDVIVDVDAELGEWKRERVLGGVLVGLGLGLGMRCGGRGGCGCLSGCMGGVGAGNGGTGGTNEESLTIMEPDLEWTREAGAECRRVLVRWRPKAICWWVGGER